MSTASLQGNAADITSLDDLRLALTPIRERLLEHPLYQAVDSIPRLRVFMKDHVFAVWDFMCLAKRLQRDLTSIEELWLPPRRPSLARFINSVVQGEESDVDPNGKAASHFDLYLAAMQEVGATVEPAQRFIESLRDGGAVSSGLVAVGASKTVQKFVAHTLETVRTGTTIEVLAAFLFGREDLIPEMFSRLLPQWGDAVQAPCFTYYVKRHIELDGDEHGPAGLRALAEMAEEDETLWQSAHRAASAAIAARIELWDSVYFQIAHA